MSFKFFNYSAFLLFQAEWVLCSLHFICVCVQARTRFVHLLIKQIWEKINLSVLHIAVIITRSRRLKLSERFKPNKDSYFKIDMDFIWWFICSQYWFLVHSLTELKTFWSFSRMLLHLRLCSMRIFSIILLLRPMHHY